jgi:epoxyqueuosine reductase
MSGGASGRPAAVMISSAGIKREAAAAGFDLCGIASASDHVELRYLREWLELGYAGGMEYLRRSADRRADVRHVLPSARSVISLGTNYNTGHPYSADTLDRDHAAIARYAWGEDYHVVIQRRLDVLLERLHATCGGGFEARAYVDTGPVQERVYAQHAGLGWIGKNTLLINPDLGSWLFLGVIITSLDLPADDPGLDRCGSCNLCIVSCPTGAIVEPRVLDARACISYLTIEKRGTIDPALRPSLGAHVYGCDICQDVCPWNSGEASTSAPEWQPRPAFAAPTLASLWVLTDAQLASAIEGTPMTRARITGLRRNLAMAIGNAGSEDALALLDRFGPADPDRPSLEEPAVIDAIAWARVACAPQDADAITRRRAGDSPNFKNHVSPTTCNSQVPTPKA